MRARKARSNGRIRSLALAGLTILGLIAPAAAAQAAATWTGASSSHWSDPGNWTGTPPASNTAAGTLSFPTLTCNTCYTSQNDLTGVSATGLVLGNSTEQYSIQGTGFTLGTDGITDTAGGGTGDLIRAPIALTDGPQTWVMGSSTKGYNSLTFQGPITGSPGAAVSASTPRGDLWVNSNMEVGPVTSNGPGGFHIGGPPGSGKPGSVNATDGQSFTINGGSLVINPGSTTGPLTLNGGTLLLGTNPQNNGTTTLQVNGTARLSSSSTTAAFINDNGSTAGTDFSQLSASGNVTVGGQLILGQGPSNGSCVALHPGDSATLVTTTGTLIGTYANAPEGEILTLGNACPGAQVQISYTTNSVIAMVPGGTTSVSTTTGLATPSPSPATTNQAVALTATVTTSGNGTVAPAGTVAFSANGAAISGCTSQPVTASGSTGTATCTTTFAATGSPESLSTAFTPTSGSGQTGSASSAQTLTVNKGSTATTLVASNTNPVAGGSLTYTATVPPGMGGPSMPSGTVAFLDGGKPISGCAAQPLMAGSSSAAATCTLSYPSAGSHTITATYGGDGNFTGSSAPAATVTVRSVGISATTSSATGIGTTQGTLNGSVSTGGAAVTWKFQYGRTTAYGQTTAAQAIAAGRLSAVKVSQVVKRLSPNVRYHYRLVVGTTGHTANGRDATFTTKATGTLMGPRAPLAVTARTILVTEKCESSVPCRGRFSFTGTVRTGKHGELATVRCASTSVRIGAHRSLTIRVRISVTCLRLLRARPHHRLTVPFTFQSQTGQVGERERVMLVLKSAGPPAP
ncbi:MAG TPA: Ig-like domain-containing protein [Solirubrobacteraceae bacterium]|nr:Ig-like domain-containing protein [Solirubrobacteraceae bacterium]